MRVAEVVGSIRVVTIIFWSRMGRELIVKGRIAAGECCTSASGSNGFL